MGDKPYIGSQQHWEDSINADYDQRERMNKEMQQKDDRIQEQPMPKEHPILFSTTMVQAILAGNKIQTRRIVKDMHKNRLEKFVSGFWPFRENQKGNLVRVECPYGKMGDRLWVRETWARYKDGQYAYKASMRDNAIVIGNPWKPSIHMPRSAARIILEITEIRLERLQSITRGDAMSEGCPFPNMADGSNPVYWFSSIWDPINAKRGFPWHSNPWVWVITFKKI